MISQILVCPFNEDFLGRFQGRRLVLRINDLDEMPRALQAVKSYQIHLHSIIVDTKMPLASIPFQEDWRDIPLALYTTGMGFFREFVKKLPLLRRLNIRVYLPTGTKENYTSLRILSSLGIESAVFFKKEGLDWEFLSDLMIYAFFTLGQHALIEPFSYIASGYDKNKRTDFSAVYFEDPSLYLHLDEKGRVALSSEDLTAENFMAQDIDEIDDMNKCDKYVEYLEGWRAFFLRPDGCAYCQGWRVCLGKFADVLEYNQGCKQFFIELMDAVEQFQGLQQKKRAIWRP